VLSDYYVSLLCRVYYYLQLANYLRELLLLLFYYLTTVGVQKRLQTLLGCFIQTPFPFLLMHLELLFLH
jgi:hypothetical protein